MFWQTIINQRRPVFFWLMITFAFVIALSYQPTRALLASISTFKFGEQSIPTGVAKLNEDAKNLGGRVNRGNTLWPVPLAALMATRERPIFAPTRRPPPIIVKSAPAQAQAANRPLLTLVGSIAGEKDGVAIFRDEVTKGIVRLKLGESHSGWLLQSIRPREATFQKENLTATLELPAPPAR
jgi:general secretion pathway protein N